MTANKREGGSRRVFIDGVEIKEVFDVLNEWKPFEASIVQIKLYGVAREAPGELRITTTAKPKLQIPK